jgi:hypothetical protein
MIDRKLLRQALSELVRLRNGMQRRTRFLGQLYASALEEWASRLNVEPPRLDKLVMTRRSASGG